MTLYLERNSDFRVFSLCLVDDVDAVDEDVFQAAAEIRRGGQVRQILLDDTSNVQLREMVKGAQSSSVKTKQMHGSSLSRCNYPPTHKTPYLRIQVQVRKISIADGRHRLTVHCEVHLSTVALDGDVVPVEIIQQAAGSQRDSPVNFVYNTVS